MIPWTLTDITKAVRAGWAADTCSADDVARAPWTVDNPAWGHCDITALVVHDFFCGELMVGEVHLHGEQHGHHWWNRLSSGIEIDLTREQFRRGQVVSDGRAVPRPTGRLPRRGEEYELLRGRVWSALGRTPV
ncbi:hypothetical protein A6A06_22995 [Streptomyces sp. CB02923]|uniref:YunG family protein n=1 Tax=Streptomyces sp. CB02923 TaxID=1718985 RepID=UPI00093969A8|nr:hypothetical protein [Streptomyces sp. CB02923]OKI00397.1 hypothetical protein A6A06_22995 [Streptomyces sp. CB02923]